MTPTNGNAKLWTVAVIILAALLTGALAYIAWRDTMLVGESNVNATQAAEIEALRERVTKLEDCE